MRTQESSSKERAMVEKEKVLIDERTYKAGYVVRREKHYVGDDEDEVILRSAYTLNNEYIGDVKMARFLILKRGIRPEFADSSHSICSIGWCIEEQKWYGWSHRAICGFGIGDKIFEERFGDDDTPFIEHGDITIALYEQARIAAVNFAEHVS